MDDWDAPAIRMLHDDRDPEIELSKSVASLGEGGD
jgi:hypothetical protein